MLTDGNLTLESMMALYDSLPLPSLLPEAILVRPRTMDALQLQKNFNHQLNMQLQGDLNRQLNMQAETLLRAIPVYYVDWLPRHYMPRRVLRSQYNSRAGYRHARHYWRSMDKKMRRAEENVAYLVSFAAHKNETEYAFRLFKQY